MHKALFKTQEEWAELEQPESAMIKHAVTIDLDVALFTECLGSREAVERIVSSVYEATSVTRATPVFVLLDGESGRPMRGAREAEKFVEVVEKHLESVLENDVKQVAEAKPAAAE